MIRAKLSERIIAYLIDFLIWSAISVILLLALFDFPPDAPGQMPGMNYFIFIINAVFFLRDINGQSPGKRIVKLRVIRKRDNEVPNILVLFTRNLFMILGGIELIVFLVDKNHERIGDKVTRTYVAKISPLTNA